MQGKMRGFTVLMQSCPSQNVMDKAKFTAAHDTQTGIGIERRHAFPVEWRPFNEQLPLYQHVGRGDGAMKAHEVGFHKPPAVENMHFDRQAAAVDTSGVRMCAADAMRAADETDLRVRFGKRDQPLDCVRRHQIIGA